MGLSEIEVYCLCQFEETDEDLYLIENEVRISFSDRNSTPEDIRRITREAIESLVAKGLVKLTKVHYKETRSNTYEVSKIEARPNAEIKSFLNDEVSWSKSMDLSSLSRSYFHATELGSKALDQLQPPTKKIET